MNLLSSGRGRHPEGSSSRAMPSLWVRARRRPGQFLTRVAIFFVAAAGAIFFALPFLWMLSTAVKPPYEIWLMPPRWIPSSVNLRNFIEPWSMLPFARYYRNTFIVVTLAVFGTLASSSLAAFGFARLRFPGRNALFLVVLATLMLPSHITLIPVYILYARLRWIDSLLPLIVPPFLGHAFSIFLMRQFMMTVSSEIDDAAKIDGAGYFRVYSRIMLPMIRPALGVGAIFAFTDHWNDFLEPLVFLSNPKWFTIALGLRLIQSRRDIQIQYTMAMTVVSLIPLLVLFFIAQKYFVQGVVITGLKG